MALQSFSIKVGVLIRSGIVYFGLMAIGFVADAEPAPGVVEGIRSIIIFTPAVVCLISAAIFLLGYKLEDRSVLQMEDEIITRKA